jgi:hypothetical protein
VKTHTNKPVARVGTQIGVGHERGDIKVLDRLCEPEAEHNEGTQTEKEPKNSDPRRCALQARLVEFRTKTAQFVTEGGEREQHEEEQG